MLLVMLLNCKLLTVPVYIAMVKTVINPHGYNCLYLHLDHCMHINCCYTIVYAFVL